MLSPLGGVAYVNPPRRPGATLWSIAAGPLVMLALALSLTVPWLVARSLNCDSTPDVYRLVVAVLFTDVSVGFYILPIYPLDGADPALLALVLLGPRPQSARCLVSGLFWRRRIVVLASVSFYLDRLIAAYAE